METLRTFDDLVRSGKIRYYGYSNVCGWQMQKIVDVAKYSGLNSCTTLQVLNVVAAVIGFNPIFVFFIEVLASH